MKILKYLFLLILITILGLVAYIGLQDGQIEISKSRKLKAPQELVFNQVADFENWNNWAQIYQLASNTHIANPNNLQDAKLQWEIDSLNMNGSINNVEVTKLSSIQQTLDINRKMENAHVQVRWNFSHEADTTSIDLRMEGKFNFWVKAKSLFLKNQEFSKYDEKTELSLSHLIESIEKEMSIFSINIDGVKTNPATNYLYQSFASKNNPEILSIKRAETIDLIHHYLLNQNAESDAPGIMLINQIDKAHNNVIVSVGVPVSDALPQPEEETELLIGELPEQRVIKGTLKGNYHNIPKLWEAISVYMSKNKLEQDPESPTYEVYKITKQSEENPANWITELIIPLKEEQATSLRSEWQLQNELEGNRDDN